MQVLLTVCQRIISDDISWLIQEDKQNGRDSGTLHFRHKVTLHADSPCNIYAKQKGGAKKVCRATSEARYNEC